MYIFTKQGLVAIAAYQPDMNNPPGWLIDAERRFIHNSAAEGERHYLVRGWHFDLIQHVITPQQAVFVDHEADYLYRGLVWAADMGWVMEQLVDGIDYYSLKASVAENQTLWSGLNDVHTVAKRHWDWRYDSIMPSYVNDGFTAMWDEWEEDHNAS